MSMVMQLIFAVLFAILPPCQDMKSVNCKEPANPYGYDIVVLDTPGDGVVIMKGEYHQGPGMRKLRDYPRAKVVENTDR